MDYNNGFNLSDIFTNDTYKSRAILAFFGLVLIVLIVFARTSEPKKNVKDQKKEEQQVEEVEQVQNIEFQHSAADEQDENSLYNRYSFIRLNNYSLDFEIKAKSNIHIIGERYDYKYKLDVDIDGQKYEYQARNNLAKVKYNDEYKTADLPYVLINYFDNNEIYNVIYGSKKISETDGIVEYKITNAEIMNILPKEVSTNIYVERPDLSNTIIVTLNNNKISEISLDLTNLVLNVDELKELNITLKYDKIGQINDFNIDF